MKGSIRHPASPSKPPLVPGRDWDGLDVICGDKGEVERRTGSRLVFGLNRGWGRGRKAFTHLFFCVLFSLLSYLCHSLEVE